MSKLCLHVRHLANTLKVGWTTIGSLLSIHKDARVKYHIHAKLSNFMIEPYHLWIIGIPVRRNHLYTAQAKIVIATPHLCDHKINRTLHRAASQCWHRINYTEAIKTVGSVTTKISAVVVVDTNIMKVFIAQFPRVDIEQ